MDQRRSFSFQEAEQKQVFVLLRESRGIERRGTLVDVGPEQAALVFPNAEAPNLAMGQEILLKFSGEKIETPIEVAAIAHSRRDQKQTRRFGVWFVNPVDVETKLFPILRTLFNRRAEFRVHPDPLNPIQVTAKHLKSDKSFTGPMEDISASGMGLQLELDAEIHFAEVDYMMLSFLLPGAANPFQVGAIIRYRELIGQLTRYGLEFDPRRSKNFLDQQRAISKYAMERQRQIVREAKQ